MNGASRKMKNPLLSAAGEGFPFENYTENTFLVPVTPATPAVLRDGAELDNYVRQEPNNTHNLAATIDTDSEFTPIPLNSEENKNSTSQTSKPGYLTSILSSLPNLSLSSITGDSSRTQPIQGFEDIQNANSYVPSQDTLRNTLPPIVANFNDPRRTNFAEVNPGSLQPPLQSTVPPTLPSTTNGPVSYRLGNQRRVKYALPPDITSSTPKQYSAPTQPLLPAQSAASPTIFDPTITTTPVYQPVKPPISTPPLQNFTPAEYLSQTSSVQESFRSSPVVTGAPYNTVTPRSVTPQNQNQEIAPEKPTVSLPIPARPQIAETITPQNTPATGSYFAFDAAQRDFPPKAETARNYSTDVPSPILKPSIIKPNAETKPTVSFAPVSAVQVSEKLEHLLAEQKEDSLDLPPTETAKSVESVSEDRSIASSDAGEKNDTFHDAHLKQETPDTSEEVNAEHESLGHPQSHEISTNVQYYQPQSFTSAADFFANKPVEYKQGSSVTSSVPTEPFTQSAISFFDAPGSNSSFSPFKYKESNADVSDTVSARDNLQQVPLSSANSAQFANVSVAQTPLDGNSKSVQQNLWANNPPLHEEAQHLWTNNPPLHEEARHPWANNPPLHEEAQHLWANPLVNERLPDIWAKSPLSEEQFPNPWANNPPTINRTETVAATCNAPVQSASPPLFYNPAQFQSEAPSSHPYVSPVNAAAHHLQNYFTPSPHDLTSGIGSSTEFFTTSSSVPEPTGLATLSPVQMSVNPLVGRNSTENVPPSFQNLASGPSEKRMQYREVYHHWFYRKKVENKVLWLPFSMQDSLRLEKVHNSSEITPETTVATDGGRFDVDILRRQRSPVYWSGDSTEVRRCSWFFKGPTESKFVPYDESTAAKLEEEYKQTCLSNNWNRRVDLNNGEYIIFHSATVQVHYLTATSAEMATSWSNSTGASSRPRVVKRGFDEFHIEVGEPEKVDHLLFLVHGIGSVCDLKFRSVEEVVDEFRSIALQLVQSHYRSASEQLVVNRIEVLPISWHTTLHSEDTGIDKKLQAITLESIPKLRHFTNDTLLDILFYTSPVYCQTIMETVGNEMNKMYALFKERNSYFNGGIYLGGHSLGSLILFDLLCHQKPLQDDKPSENDTDPNEEQKQEETDPTKLSTRVLKRRLSKKISYVIGAAGTGQPYIHYPQLHFHPRAFFALGSPIGMFVTVRGIDMLGEDFVLPTCPAFFNIFHPFDPVAYRVEALINPDAPKYRPMLIPHHKGRKRMHLELKETMARVGADLKQRLLDSVRNTWNSVYQLAVFHKSDTSLEREIDKVVEEQLQQPLSPVSDQQNYDDDGADFKVGKLNGGRRIDYVLQEAPFEYINEYIFALTSHVCYWESEDTMLMMLKEIYGSSGIQSDVQLPQQTMTIERACPSPSLAPPSFRFDERDSPVVPVLGMDPTSPVSEKPVGPPPKSGFVKKS